MFEGHDQAVFESLAADPAVVRRLLEETRAALSGSGRTLADAAVEDGLIDRAGLLRALAAHLGADSAVGLPSALPEETVALVAPGVARHYGIVPLGLEHGCLRLAPADPFRPHLEDEAAFALGRAVRLVLADPRQVAALLRRHYDGEDPQLEAALAELRDQAEVAGRAGALTEADLEQFAGRTPIVRYVNLVLGEAIRDRASDVHFEPFENDFRVRCRVDGTLRELPPPPRALARPVISRLKVLANLNIAERRVPQDGRIKVTLEGRPVDLRVSTLPTQFGESVVLRVLDQGAVRLELRELGLPEATEAAIRGIIRRPNGIFVVTGPTGSGKTTTLYGCLRVLNEPAVKILTVEDPVEYEIDGLMQVPVNPAADLTFARALRSFLRQDPDIVMVGEIRDLETAQIAIQASLTGHLVLTTLHTNDAPGAVTRLIDMGVEPFLLASTLEGVLAQRLVRRLCTGCREPYRPEAWEWTELGADPATAADRTFCRARGCPACDHAGYRGRLGIFELMPVTETLRDLMVSGVSLEQLRRAAASAGMVPLRTAGLQAVLAGETTVEEVAKYT